MSEKINTKRGEQTDVKDEQIIDFSPLDTASREDDEAWNVMKFYGESDDAEGAYQPPVEKSQKELEAILKRAKAAKIGESILAAVA